jgi:hypothetical protein
MGSYNGNAIRLKVKKDAPAELLAFLDYIFQLQRNADTDEDDVIPDQLKHIQEFADEVQDVLSSGPYDGYMPTYCWRVKEDKGDHWLYESRSHSKHHGTPEVKSFIEGLLPAMIINDGDIVYRTVYEETATETVLYYKDGQLYKRDGFQYGTDHGYINDERHPYNARHDSDVKAKFESGELTRRHRLEEDDHLPWTHAELEKYLADKEAKRKKEWEADRKRGGWGYGQ